MRVRFHGEEAKGPYEKVANNFLFLSLSLLLKLTNNLLNRLKP
jgi:hypothetical protein